MVQISLFIIKLKKLEDETEGKLESTLFFEIPKIKRGTEDSIYMITDQLSGKIKLRSSMLQFKEGSHRYNQK